MPFVIAGLALALILITVIFVVRSLIIICPPNRVAIISGRTKQTADGRTVGYRAVKELWAKRRAAA